MWFQVLTALINFINIFFQIALHALIEDYIFLTHTETARAFSDYVGRTIIGREWAFSTWREEKNYKSLLIKSLRCIRSTEDTLGFIGHQEGSSTTCNWFSLLISSFVSPVTNRKLCSYLFSKIVSRQKIGRGSPGNRQRYWLSLYKTYPFHKTRQFHFHG